MGNRNNQKNKRKEITWNSNSYTSAVVTTFSNGVVGPISMPKMSRDCKCELCVADKKVEEFFTKKRYWWTHR